MCHSQIDTDRSGNKVSVRISSTPTIHRTRIHAGTTSDTVQSLDMVGMGQQGTPSIIYNNNMIFTSFTGIPVLRGISSDRLSRCRTCQQTGKHSQSLHVRYNLFHAESSNIQCRARCTHIGISFIGTNHNISGRRHSKVGSRHSGFCIQKDIS